MLSGSLPSLKSVIDCLTVKISLVLGYFKHWHLRKSNKIPRQLIEGHKLNAPNGVTSNFNVSDISVLRARDNGKLLYDNILSKCLKGAFSLT